MKCKVYNLPNPIIDTKEETLFNNSTEAYNKMKAPSPINKMIGKIGEKVPAKVKDYVSVSKERLTENEIYLKSLEILGKGFQILEQYASKVTLSDKDVIIRINPLVEGCKITSLDEVCLARGYEISKLVNKAKLVDIIAAIIEGAATGAPGFAGIPFNLVLSMFLFYRAVQSVAMFYGYDIKNDPIELQIASEVFANAMNPKSKPATELSTVVAKIMLLTSTTTVKNTVKKGWFAMADRGGITLLIAQMRALANNAAKKALEKAGKNGFEKTAFTEVFEQLGNKLTQSAIKKSIPYIGAVIGATIDSAQMIQILKYADLFYSKRFILEKEMRINMLLENNQQSLAF